MALWIRLCNHTYIHAYRGHVAEQTTTVPVRHHNDLLPGLRGEGRIERERRHGCPDGVPAQRQALLISNACHRIGLRCHLCVQGNGSSVCSALEALQQGSAFQMLELQCSRLTSGVTPRVARSRCSGPEGGTCTAFTVHSCFPPTAGASSADQWTFVCW